MCAADPITLLILFFGGWFRRQSRSGMGHVRALRTRMMPVWILETRIGVPGLCVSILVTLLNCEPGKCVCDGDWLYLSGLTSTHRFLFLPLLTGSWADRSPLHEAASQGRLLALRTLLSQVKYYIYLKIFPCPMSRAHWLSKVINSKIMKLLNQFY